MNTQEQSIYQSGQNVLVDGFYEAVAVRDTSVAKFSIGDKFPNYDGRAICWHLLKSQPVEKVAKQTTAFSEHDFGGMYA